MIQIPFLVRNKAKFILFLLYFFSTYCIKSQNIGIETIKPRAKLHLAEGDIFLQNSNQGIILKSANNRCWKLSVDNNGNSIFSSFPCPDSISTITYNNQTYKIRLMPDNRWWMTENLNVGTMILSTNNMTDNNLIEKYCVGNNEASCTSYGGLYQWDEIMQYSSMSSSQGICPNGWHIPSATEWQTLEFALAGPIDSRLAGAHVAWFDGPLDFYGTGAAPFGDSGFEAFPSGDRDINGTTTNISLLTYFWSSTEENATNSWSRYINFQGVGFLPIVSNKAKGYSVRCIED